MTQAFVFYTDDLAVFFTLAEPDQPAHEVRPTKLGLLWLHANAVGEPLAPAQNFGGVDPAQVPESLYGVRMHTISSQERWVDPAIRANMTSVPPVVAGTDKVINVRPRTKGEWKMLHGRYDEDEHREQTALIVVSDHLSAKEAAGLSPFTADELKAEAEGWHAFD